ncbi:YhbY family RNA-binding protein [Bombilactobacillus thymidiniphilus]|uniref:YhbY family RNA-binding protein n=1 Tax=Bombilactobacillus thymidiniphilus TaxID=2923363 RepID=A0ABY4PDL0_9LACO|nr:YhbY family RNA-binding protein [Bombilactobacillus thymidiniphilus]UQS83367.1 YhbY family RNA-binding protein [Bombilactobacillus thymidiniphilus]
MITNKQRKYLRSKAQPLSAAFQIGKNGVNQAVLAQLLQQLETHELLKVNILQNSTVTPEDLATALTQFNAQVQWVNSIGRTVIFYKKASKVKNRQLSVEVEQIK